MSFPLIGVALIVCAGLQNVLAAPQNTKPTKKSSHKTNLVQVELSARARKIMVSAGLIILIICAAISLKIQTNWRNIDALWSRTIAVNPNSWFAYRNWAAHYEELGQRQRAIELYEKSLALKPDSMVYTRVGIMYFDEKNAEKARQAFTEAVRLDPTNAVAAQNLRLL